MTMINKLSTVDTLEDGDLIPVWDTSNGDTRKAPISTLKETLLNDAALTGQPTAPTSAVGDNSTNIATTAFVRTSAPGISVVYQALSTGNWNFSLVESINNIWVIFTGSVSAGQVGITLPPNPFDGQEVAFNFKSTGTAISAMNFSPASGNLVFMGGTPLSTYASAIVKFCKAENTWYSKSIN